VFFLFLFFSSLSYNILKDKQDYCHAHLMAIQNLPFTALYTPSKVMYVYEYRVFAEIFVRLPELFDSTPDIAPDDSTRAAQQAVIAECTRVRVFLRSHTSMELIIFLRNSIRSSFLVPSQWKSRIFFLASHI
jgi:hypothetical protein